ncbi:MAG: beta-lactamase [Thermomicrobiales bacterium]|nr:beta-lactamase [Thermomicrobiales bacterium]
MTARARPRRVGTLKADERAISDALRLVDEWIGPQGPEGVGAAVWHRGEIVAEHAVGEAKPGEPVTPETLFALASVTKPISAATVMSLVDRGGVSLDEPVGRLLPEFRAGPAAGAEGVDPALERLRPTITTRQLLCHVSGLPEDLGARETRYEEIESIDEVIDQMCRLPLLSAPGDELRYSNAGYGVLARLAERVSGTEFWKLTSAEVLGPLGIRDIVADPRGSELARVAYLADTNHKRRHWTGDLTSPHTFCHFGHAGTLLWGDPDHDLALAVFCNRTVTHMWAFIMTRWARLSNAVVAAASR